MTVVVKYVVVRNGKEVMTFSSKKEADAHDKMLEIAEGLFEFLQKAEPDIAADKLDELSFFIAKNRDQFAKLLKGGRPTAEQAAAPAPSSKNASPPQSAGEKALKRAKPKAAEAA